MKKKKILLLSDDLRMHSGVATMSRELVLGTLHSYDWVQIAGAIKHPEAGKVVDMKDACDKLNNRTDNYLRLYPVDGYGSQELIRQLIEIEKPDAIIVSSPSLFPIVRAKKWAIKFKAQLIFEVRDIWPLTLQNLAGISTVHPLIVFMKWFEKFAYKNCDKIVSVLPGAHLHVKTYGIHEEKITCIPNGIDLEEVEHPEQLDNSVNEKIPFGKFIVGYAGSIGVSNALDSFIEAAVKFNENKEIVFVIFGNGAEKEKLMKKALGCNAILFFEPVKKEQFQSLLNRFDICYIGWKKESLYRFGISANKIFHELHMFIAFFTKIF
jgi:glycosyltransferase involved in cell wall biosynthesis